jgi:hypothetical protein
MKASGSANPAPPCLGSLLLGEQKRGEETGTRRRCGNAAPWEPWKSLFIASIVAWRSPDFSTVPPALGNRAQSQGARFPHSHSDDGGSRSSAGRTTPFAGELDNRGWLSREKTPQPVGGEIFLLTSPFIERLFMSPPSGEQANRNARCPAKDVGHAQPLGRGWRSRVSGRAG